MGQYQGDWFAVIDLKDTYFHVSICPEYHQFLRFTLDGVFCEFKALPFGLSTVLQVFTKCLAPVATHLRLHGITVFPYLDDWLLTVPRLHSILFTLSLLSELGLQMNQDKSTLHSTQRVTYIGGILDATSS